MSALPLSAEKKATLRSSWYVEVIKKRCARGKTVDEIAGDSCFEALVFATDKDGLVFEEEIVDKEFHFNFLVEEVGGVHKIEGFPSNGRGECVGGGNNFLEVGVVACSVRFVGFVREQSAHCFVSQPAG